MADLKKVTCFECGQVNRAPADRIAGAKCGSCGSKLASPKAIDVDFATLQKAARNDEVPLVVDFWAPWCGPCRQMAPEYSKAAQAVNGDVRLVKLNTEDYPAASRKYGIRGIPTMIGFKKGKEVKRQAGAMPGSQIVSWVKGV